MRLSSRRKLTLVAIGILCLIRYTTPSRPLSDDKNDPTGKSSLAFVFDITGSMFDDLVQVREGAAKIFKTVMAQREKLIYNYIMVPFHDPHLGDIINTTDSTYFMRQLGKVYVHGGGDCPEKTLTGIMKALEISLPTSFIYVFTDARSKDYHLEDEVLNLIQEKQSSVVFVMTGDCGNRTHPGFRTYEKIAAASFGQVFHLEKSDVSTVLEYVRHAVKQKKVHVMYEARERGGTTVRTIPVDAHLSELTISLSGDKDDSDVLDITLRDPNGAAVDKQSYSKEGGTIDLKNVKLIRLKNPIPGPWQVITNSRLKHTIRVFGHGSTDFKYGFSARPLEHSDLLSFTRPRPVLNQNTYLIINMTGLIPPGMVSEIALVDYHGNILYSNTASPHRTNPHMYFVGPFIPPKGLFFVQVTGVDEEDYEFKRIAPTAIGSVVVGGPRAFMASYHEAFVGNDLNITCTVESVSPYTVYWNRGGQRIGGPLFYQNTDSAVWSISELSLKDGGEYQCQVISDNGNHSISTRVEPRESPPMILGARNISVPNGSPAFLHCPARSAGPVEIRWIRHGATVFTGPNTERNLLNGTLKIHVVSRADAGLYECQARNAGGMSSQVIRLDIMEPPTVEANPDEVHFNPNDEITLNCAGNGEPKPELHWYHNGRRLTSDGKYYLGAESRTLMIRGSTAYDEGQYECRAMSPAGQAIDAVDVILAVSPKVELTQSKTMVGRGDSISFDCKILTGKPYPKIRWLRNGKDLLVHDDKYIKISGTNLFITGAQDSDAGSYSCVAENMAGRDINVAQLAIGRIPSIVPSPETVRVNIERQVTLQCLAIGFPTPEIEWEKGGVSIKNLNNDRYTQLADGNLLITDAQVEDQDRFTCIAKNVYGQQSQTTTVMVTGLVSPVLGHVPPEEQLIEGQDLHLSCVVVLGTPRPNIVWLKDGNPIETSSTLIIEGGGTSLLLRGGDPKDEGKYTCVAVSPAGNATLNINVQLIKKPEFVRLSEKPSEKPVVPGIEASHVALVNSTHDVLDGEGFAIPCVVSGQPPPTITWYLDGRPIAANSKDFVILPDNTLVVKRADKSYSGKYACQATNSAGEEQQTTTVRIMTSPTISPGQSSFNMVVNQSLTIPCDVFGDPKPKISWFLDDKPFTEGMVNEDGSLTIPMVREDHRGTLSCKAENAAGNDTRAVTLTVHTTPQINADNQDRSVVKNSTLTLECPAQALPPPVRIWTYEGEKIDTLPIPHTILKDGSLVLHNVDVTNAGLFSCHVSNLAGEDSLTYKVTVHEAPKIVSDLASTVEVVKGLTIEIPCRATGIPVVDRVWQKDGHLYIPDNVKAAVDSHGTLRIYDAKKEDSGNYNCFVSNSVGGDTKSTTIVVQEPPTILPSTNVNYTAVIGDRLELRCDVEAFPPANIQWYRRGIPIGNETRGAKVEDDGTLTIEESKLDDSTMYTCKATNEAGKAETNVFVNVIAPPQISDQDTPLYESIRIGTPLTLFCPVYSLPLPTITWFLDDKPLWEYDPSLVISPDRRKLYWAEATTKQPGVYKCVAKNAAGESSKMFNIEVTHPLVVNEELYPLKWNVYEGENITIGCPVMGYPAPSVTWIINGKVLGPDEEYNGAHVTQEGLTVEFNGVLPKHEGKYQCIAQNKVEKVSVDIQLSVLAIPKLGPDEHFAITKGKSFMFTCDVLNGVDDSTVIRWSMNGSDNLPSNIEISMNGERLYITEIARDNQGEYVCRVSNSAGKGSKKILLDVLELPEFLNPSHRDNWQFTEGRPLDLDCSARGNPFPVITWFYDKKNVTGEPTNNDNRFRIDQIPGKSAVITCEATNDGGTIARSFFVFKVSPPKISDESDGNPSVKEGGTLSLECPVSQGDFTITWLRQGSEIKDDDVVITLDGTRMTILNARKDHQDVYTCVASNTAGQASKDFNVEVHYPPKIAGSAVLTIQANAGTEVTIDCEAEGYPRPEIFWEKDNRNIGDLHGGLITNDQQTIVFKNVSNIHSGHYQCSQENSAGEAAKTISLVVVDPPRWTIADDPIKYVVNATKSLTIECPAEPGVNLDYLWMQDGMPIGVENYGWQILGNGRMLHIPNARPDDSQDFSCAVSNSAGKITKAFSLYVQVGPTFNNIGGEHTVIEHNSLVLPCEVEGRPKPTIKWTKDGQPISSLGSVQVLSEGQQLKILNAEMQHRGTYLCSATNSYGTEEISFEVDVITRPTIAKGVRDTVEVKQTETAVFKCPIEDNNFRGQIIWLRNLQPIELRDRRLSLSQGDRRLSLKDSMLEDEGVYSCKLKNDAGETKFDYKLIVSVPPKILMLEKDKKREVVEQDYVIISCPATGKDEPKITWYKDGQLLKPNDANNVLIRGNELVFEEVKDEDSGRYTCEAVNNAGSAEQEVNLFVMTKPRIEEEGIPDQFEGLRDQRITISCPVFGKPPPAVYWLKYGKPLESDENVKTSANGQKLYFLKLRQEDSDTYTCLAKNIAGESIRNFVVTMLVSPSFDEPNIVRQIHTNAGKPSVLNCPAQGSPPPTITWLKDGIAVEENERYVLLDGGRQLQISNTDESDEGRFTCIATNSVGSDDIETSLNVISAPVIDGPPTEKVSSNEGKRIDLECPTSTTGVDIEWQKNGLTITPETLRGDAYIQIPSSGKRLTFLSPASKDAGKYTCIVRNSAGETRKNIDFSINVPPFISMTGSSPLVQTVTPGSRVTVDCSVTGEPFPEIKWYLDGVEIEKTNPTFEILNYDMALVVNNINEETIGKYTCSAENVAGKTHQDFIVRMKAPPTFDRISESIDVKIGESIDLPCDVQSAIPVTYNWTGKSMRPDIGALDTKLLTLKDAQLGDQGVYICVVDNDAGQAKKMIELNVIDPPEFYDTQKNYPIVLGRPLTLDCSASGSPEPTIIWMKNGRRLNESYEPMMFGKTHLMIDNPQEDVAGRYTCIAENKAGRAEKDMIVAILKPPVMKDNVLNFNVLETGSVPLPCNVLDPTGDLEYTWLRNGSAITPNDRLQISIQKDKLHIMNAEISDTGKYTCIVKNQAGEARTDFYLTVDIPPKIEGDPFTSQSAVANQTVKLDCKAIGRPTPSILWLFDGKPLLEKQNVEIAADKTHIILKNITTKEEGRYTCRVLNSVGQVDQDTYIEVLVPPTVVMPSDEMKVVAGKQTTVRCEVFGDPEPEVKWLKNGEVYVSDLLQYSKGFSYLHLRHASLRDSGRYTCIATNKAGEERASTVVQVLIPPSITEDERVLQAKENTTFSIHCAAVGNPTPTFTWKKDGVEIPEATSATLTLPNVDSTSDGRYTCLAANEGGTATADFMLDVITRPKFAESEKEIKVIEGERTRMECRVDGHPKPTIKWLKGGRPLNMSNVLLSPRGEVLMILKARRSDGGSYSCVAKNAAGEAEAGFNVNILTVPYIEDQIDQNPKIVAGNTLRLRCPVRGNPKPTVRWSMGGRSLTIGDKYTSDNGQDLIIENSNISDEGFYTCHAENEAGSLATNFAAEVIGKPTFERQGDNIYEVIEDTKITIDCGVTSKPLPEISWYRGENPLYLSENFEISNDGMKLTIRNTKLTDGGKYTCRASNEAGSADIDLIVKVLVPPKIDKSNIIGNPLAIVTRNIYLECPVFGIPQPSVIWTKDGRPVNTSDSRIVFAHNNETFGIEGVQVFDQGRYTCTASNRGGSVAHDFNLDVLSPPVFEIADTKPTIKREGDTITLSCPIKMPDDVADQVMDVSWTKDSRALEGDSSDNIEISEDGRRLTISSASLSNAGMYSCIALNRAGETSLEFKVEILSPPIIDTSRNDIIPQVALNQPTIMYCPVTGHPFPAIKWLKDGQPVEESDNIRILDQGQTIQILRTEIAHAGKWSCVAENDAGVKELEMILDVFTPPVVQVTSEKPIKALGETITIYCNATGNPPPHIKWSKGGQPIIDSPEGARISLKGARLDIPHLKKTDVGDYTCHAYNDAGSAESSISVDVLVPPEIKRDGIDMSPRLPAGQSLTLDCSAEGKPSPKLRWTLNNTNIDEKTAGITIASDMTFIQINNVSLADKGVYTCIAENVAGSDRLMYNVDVVQAPVISNGGTQQIIEGELAVIECLVEGYPTPQVSWLRNGIRVETGVQGVRYLAEDKKLTVIEARSSDSGIYVCAATNEAGTAQQAYTLEVLVSPKIVSSSPTTISPPSGTKFSLPCLVRGYPEPQIIWNLNGRPITNGQDGYMIGNDGTLTVEKAEGRNLVYECTAKNDAGADTIEYKVQTINAPKISDTGVRYVNGSEGEQTAINCDIEGDDYDITWLKNGSPLLPTNNLAFSEDKKTINVVSTRLSDQGEYSCTATNKAGNATLKTNLNVGVPAKISDRPKTQVVNRGDQVTLWCEAFGVPQPSIDWYKDDQLITNTAVADTTNTKKKSAIFSAITPSDAGVYTCKAENWAGAAEEDVDLIVMIAPEVVPEKMNVSTNPRQTVFLSCNATGIPEPVITWMKDPNIAIQANEKYQLLGTTLAIRNVLPEDDGFYHCIAKSDAGQKIASRKLIVNKPTDRAPPIWVECDENGKPKKTEYMVDRGDSPDDNPQLLPWKDVEDSSVNMTYRCMPGPRSARTVLLHAAPQFIVTPKNHTAAIGAVVDMKCSATGPPMPAISWAKNGRMIPMNKTEIAYSVLKVRIDNTSDAGNYTCYAQNSVGISTATAELKVNPIHLPTPPTNPRKNVAVITCYDRQIAYSRGITWEFRGVPLQRNLAGVHFMNNGSLVILDTSQLAPGDLELYTCKVRNRRRYTKANLLNVFDEAPVVRTADKITVDVGQPVLFDCEVSSNPFTTNVIWTKNDHKLIDDDVSYVLPNNSLVLLTTEKYDDGVYKCVASNSIGKAYDAVELVVNDGETSEFNLLTSAESSGLEPNDATTIGKQRRRQGVPSPDVPTTATTASTKPTTTSSTVITTTKSTPTTTSPSTTTTTTTQAPTTTTNSPVHESSADSSEQYFEMTAEPTTLDMLYEYPPNPVANVQVMEMTECVDGTINESGDCIGPDGKPKKMTLLLGEDNCPEGFSWNTRSGICDDIDECVFDQPCDFKCINLEGGFECQCPHGYDVLNDDECVDINECELTRCEDDKACFNQLGGYQCIDDPCPSNFSLVDDRYCEPDCEDCGIMPITVHMLSIPSGLPVSHIATLTAYDKNGKVLNDTTYVIAENYKGLDLGRTRLGPFTIKSAKGGHAHVWTNQMLQTGANYKVRVRAHSDQGMLELNTPKETNFLVLINVGQYPF